MNSRNPAIEPDDLAPREREVLDVLLATGAATAVDIQGRLQDPPSNSTVRKMLSRLEAKGLVTYRRDGARFVYRPTVPRSRARRRALSRLIRVFFGGSAARAALAALQDADTLTGEELDELETIVRKAREGA
ncbi:MAG: BlaI/MecI/CopY family transcriptional regulator [Planctomycetota bacterium]